MAVNTLDELDDASYTKVEAAIKKFRKSKKSRNDEHTLYEAMTNAGITAEGADEYINLETENGDD